MYYKAVMSNKIFNERSFLILDDIFGPGAFEAWVRAGALIPVKRPSAIDLLKNDQMFEATRLYHEIHEGSTVKESIDMVKKSRPIWIGSKIRSTVVRIAVLTVGPNVLALPHAIIAQNGYLNTSKLFIFLKGE